MKLKKSRLILMMVALCLSVYAILGDMVLIPVADFLYGTYDNVGVVSYILSGPALISAIVCAFSGKIIQKIGARMFLVIGFGIYTLSTVLTIFSQELILFIICRTLQGVGMGTITVGAIVVISEHFVDEKKRSAMIGIFNGSASILGAALGVISGIVATTGWENVFYMYLATIPIFVMLLLFIPKDPKILSEENVEERKSTEQMPWGIVIRVAMGFFVFNLVYSVVYYQIAVVMADKGINDTAYVGMLSALGTIGSFFTSVTFGAYYARLKRNTVTVAYFAIAVFFTLLYFSTNEIILAITCTLIGAAYGMGLAHYLTYPTMIVPPSLIPISSAVANFAMGIAQFLAAYLPYGLMAIMGTDSITVTILPLIAVLVIGGISSVIFGRKEKHYFARM